MGICKLIFLSSSLALVLFIYKTFIYSSHKIPEVYFKDHYWGKEEIKDGKIPLDNAKIYQFKILYDKEMVDDLNLRLKRTKFIEPLEGAKFEYGFNGNELKRITEYWYKEYNWNKTIHELNSFPHFKTEIEGLKIHFLHIKSKKKSKNIFPLVLCHGWPGSFYEFFKIIPYLIEEEQDISFDLIIPSIPGFGFSDKPFKKGFDATHTSRIFVKLMKRLGYRKFFYHGGDWGSVIGESLIAGFPNTLLGAHLTLIPVDLRPQTFVKLLIGYFIPKLIYDDEKEIRDFSNLKDKAITLINELGYFFLQSTKPDTIGALLIDSPAGLAAYILEKFSTWVSLENKNLDCGGLTKKFKLDELLTNVMIYWVSGNSGYAQRYYKEFSLTHFGVYDISKVSVDENIPIGFSFGENEIWLGKAPRAFLKYKNLIHYQRVDDTGHFSVFEEPVKMNVEIRTFVNKALNHLLKTSAKQEL